jgi:hypothetical protein
MPILQSGERVENERYARFHIENAGPGQFVVLDAAGHFAKCAERIDGVIVAEQQQRLPGLASEVDLQMITSFFGSVEADFSAQARKFLRHDFGKTVDGGFVVTGRFDFDELTDHRDDRVLTVGEISKTALGFGARANSLFSRNATHASVLPAKAILENNKFRFNGKGHCSLPIFDCRWYQMKTERGLTFAA